jgi:PAS domain S-box-containing protein
MAFPPHVRRCLSLTLAYGGSSAAGILLFRDAGAHLWSRSQYISVPWIPAGVAVAALLLGGQRLASTLFVTFLVVWMVAVPLPAMTGLIQAAGVTLAYLAIVRTLRVGNFSRRFDRLKDPLLLLGAAGLGMAIAESADLVSLPLTAWISPQRVTPDMSAMVRFTTAGLPVPSRAFLDTTVRWWVNGTAGIALTVPILVAEKAGLRLSVGRHLFELAGWGIALLAWTAVSLTADAAQARMPLFVAGIALVTWAAVRFVPPIAAGGALFCSLIACGEILLQRGPLAGMDAVEGATMLWEFVAAIAMPGLLLSALLAERERTSTDSRRNAERLEQALRTSMIGIFEFEHPTGLYYCSPETRAIFGLDAQEPVTFETLLDRFHPDDRAIASEAIARSRDPAGDGLLRVEHRIRRPDGVERWLVARSTTTFSGGGRRRRPGRTVGAVLDITERKRDEEALRASETRLKEAQRLGSMGSWEYDWTTRQLGISAEASRIFEFEHGPPERLLEGYVDIAHPDDRPLVRETFADIVARQRAHAELTHRLLMADGRVKFVTEQIRTSFGANGRPTHTFGTAQDITERRRLESAALDAAEQERQRMASELHDNLGQLLFGASLMVDSLAPGSAGRVAPASVIPEIRDSLREALRVCREVAHTAAPVVEGGLATALQNLAARSQTAGIRCIARCSDAAAHSVSAAQALELFRVAQEAITNSLRHSGCRLISVSLRMQGSSVELRIADDGVGFQESTRTTGAGLGLRTMSFRAERAGGTIHIARQRTGGTLIRVLVPREIG